MTPSNTLNNAANATSLAAITMGAVAAAFVIMSIGSLVTIISIGSSLGTGAQASASLENDGNESTYVAVVSSQLDKIHTIKKTLKKHEKNHFMDAVLREDSHNTPTAASEKNPQQPLPSKSFHVFANLMPSESQTQVSLA